MSEITFQLVEDKMDQELTIQITAREAWVIASQLLIDMGGSEDLSDVIDTAYNGVMLALIDGGFVEAYREDDENE